VAVVVIRSNGKADRAVESLRVKALGGQVDPGQIRLGGASNLAGRSNVRTSGAPKYVPHVKRIVGDLGTPSLSDLGEGQCR
jgi:hypothetical protein